MPSKKKKYNARFPAGRIKKIMQSDEEVGKVAQAVPIIISRTLELFVESLLTKTLKITNSRNAKTLSTSHMKQCIMSEQRFDFLRELVRSIPDISVAEEAANYNEEDNQSSPEEQYPDSDTPYDLSMPSTSLRAGRQQQQQQQTASNGHNGGGHHAHVQPHQEYQRNYLKRSLSTNPSSVIRHTTTSLGHTSVDCLPAKLARSDSTPVPQQLSAVSLISTVQQHPRLKHQSYSMPAHMENNNNNNNNNKNNNQKPNTQTPQKLLRTPSQPTAIPAPIVNIDYCSKPVVKIDYSNLPLAGVTTSAHAAANTPLSAPANIASMSGKNTAFNFSAEPVISIDLSNIVASATAAAPSVATISIGTPTLTPPPKPPSATLTSASASSSSLTSSSLINKTKPSSAKQTAVVDQQSRNSKAAMAEPFNSSSSSSSTKATALAAAVAAATTMTTTSSTSKSESSSYLDMDEDYDNI